MTPPTESLESPANGSRGWIRSAGDWVWQWLLPVLRNAVTHWSSTDGFLLSAAMAYYVSLALFPLLLVLMAGLGMLRKLPFAQGTEIRLLDVVEESVDPWLADQLRLLLDGVESGVGIGGPIGLASLALAAVAMFAQLDGMMDRIWASPAPSSSGIWGILRRTLIDRAQAFAVLLGVGGLVVVVFVCDLALAAASPYIVELPAGRLGLGIARSVVTLAINALLFTTIYKTLPRASVYWSDALCGGVLVAVAWNAGQRLLTTYVIGEKFTAYGVVGSFLAVMLWVYYASATTFFGAEIVWAAGQQRSDGDSASQT